MNTRQKGKLLVKKVKLNLEKQDFLADVARPRMCFVGPGKVFSKEEDFFGKWDIVAVNNKVDALKVERDSLVNSINDPKVEKLKKVIKEVDNCLAWVQVGTWSNAATKMKDVKDFPNIGTQEIWLWVSQRENSHFKILKRENEFEWLGDCYKQ